MRRVIKILPLIFLLVFICPGITNLAYAQKGSIRYSNPEKDTKKERKRISKERRLNEKRRAKQLKEKGVGADKKTRRAAAKANRKKDKTGSYLDRVLTDKKQVSSSEKQAAYKRDRKLNRSKNRQKFRMKQNRIRKKRKPSKGNE